MKKHFNKELPVTKKDVVDFENSRKCWISDNVFMNGDVKVTDHFHVTGKYRGPLHRDCDIKVELNQKIHIVFRRLKNYDSHLIIEQLGKFNFTINVITNGLEKYMSLNIDNKLAFIDSFQFLSSSLNIFVKNLSKQDFKYLS